LCEREMGEGKCKIPRFEMKKRFGKWVVEHNIIFQNLFYIIPQGYPRSNVSGILPSCHFLLNNSAANTPGIARSAIYRTAAFFGKKRFFKLFCTL
jgi:hypothetical protein